MAMEPKREAVRLPNPGAQPFVSALKTTRFFAVVFFWITMMALLVHLAAFVAAEWVGLYDEPAPEAAEAPEAADAADAEPAAPVATAPAGEEGAPAAEPAEGAAEPETDAGAPPEPDAAPEPEPEPELEPMTAETPMTPSEWRALSAKVLVPVRMLGIVTGPLLWLSLFLYLQIGLLGRLAGIRQLTRAVFVTLLFLATALPWWYVFPDIDVGAFFTFDSLLAAQARYQAAPDDDTGAMACYFGRYFVLPVVSFVLLLAAGLQFASGYGESVVANE